MHQLPYLRMNSRNLDPLRTTVYKLEAKRYALFLNWTFLCCSLLTVSLIDVNFPCLAPGILFWLRGVWSGKCCSECDRGIGRTSYLFVQLFELRIASLNGLAEWWAITLGFWNHCLCNPFFCLHGDSWLHCNKHVNSKCVLLLLSSWNLVILSSCDILFFLPLACCRHHLLLSMDGKLLLRKRGLPIEASFCSWI